MLKYLFCIYFLGSSILYAQPAKVVVDSINRYLDWFVVAKNISFLEKHYADDFVFTHGTGFVEGKSSWLKNVRDTSVHYLSREHDSVTVELHKKIAVVKGQLVVRRRFPSRIDSYGLKYIRVYQFRKKRWQLISHNTTREWHF